MKKIFLSALLIAGALSSCSENEIVDKAPTANDNNIDVIGMEIATAVSRGTETTADGIRKSSDLTLSFYATHFDSTADASTTATPAAYVGKISFEYVTDAWAQTAYEYITDADKASGEPTKVTEINGDDMLWGHMSIGDTGSDDATPTSYFFSMHDGTNNFELDYPDYSNASDINVTVTATSGNPAFTQLAGYDGVNVPTETIADQQDVVFYAGEISAFPAGGKIRGTFQHALSRIELYSNQGDYAPYVKSVSIANIQAGGTPTITYVPDSTSDDKATIAWDEDGAGDTTYLYYNGVDTSAQSSGLPLVEDEIITDADYKFAAPQNNVMVVPHSIAASVDGMNGVLQPAADDFDTYDYTEIDGTYIAVIYRMMDTNTNESVVGYMYAMDCDAYADMVADETAFALTDIDSSTAVSATDTTSDEYKAIQAVNAETSDYDKSVLAATVTPEMGITKLSHLYVLVGFPFSEKVDLANGKDYDLHLGFGVTGGILLHEYYVDAFGRSTNIPITDIEVGDAVLATAQTAIGITITVDSWVDASTGDYNPDL